MLSDVLFLCIIFSVFIVGGFAIIAVDFIFYYLFDFSPLLWLEKFLYERFGK